MKKPKVNSMKSADPNSVRSKKRKNRGFISLEKSSRKHRRAARRSAVSCNQYGKQHVPGTKVDGGGKGFVHIAGGSIKYN